VKLRARVLLTYAAAWATGLLLVLVTSLVLGRLHEGVWAVGLLFVTSLPMLLAGALVISAFPHAVAKHPALFAVAAVFITGLAGASVAKWAGTLFAVMAAVPAALAFTLLAKRHVPRS
jgi:hypothetical protein